MLINIPFTEEGIRKLYDPEYQEYIHVDVSDKEITVWTVNSPITPKDEISYLAFRRLLQEGVYEGYGLISRRKIKLIVGWKMTDWLGGTAAALFPDLSDQLKFIDGSTCVYYGIGDSPEQIFSDPRIKRSFIDTPDEYVCELSRKQKGVNGGWRWHKNGKYIGKQKPLREFFKDEPIIEEVWFYHFHRVLHKG